MRASHAFTVSVVSMSDRAGSAADVELRRCASSGSRRALDDEAAAVAGRSAMPRAAAADRIVPRAAASQPCPPRLGDTCRTGPSSIAQVTELFSRIESESARVAI
jgi:hypothetical protein